MELDLFFFLGSALLGLGLAMDAFSVSLANGLSEPKMKKAKAFSVAAVFAAFQAAMPLIGWVCVHTAVHRFSILERYIPWVSLAVLTVIGANMIFDGAREKEESENTAALGAASLLFQAVATSIDALSVGFTISEYELSHAVLSVLVIAAVTFFVCLGGIMIGKKFGVKLSGKAQILGGIILIAIGFEILISGIL